MPIYDFKCECGVEVECIVRLDDVVLCDPCGKEMIRQISKPALPIFRGTGFYETDYKKRSRPSDPEE